MLLFLTISVRAMFSQSARPIFALFAAMLELSLYERSDVCFLFLQGMLPWQPILWAKLMWNPHVFAINRSVLYAVCRWHAINRTPL